MRDERINARRAGVLEETEDSHDDGDKRGDNEGGEVEVFSREQRPDRNVDVRRFSSGLAISLCKAIHRVARPPDRAPNVVSLGTSYKQILPESWVVLERPNATRTHRGR